MVIVCGLLVFDPKTGYNDNIINNIVVYCAYHYEYTVSVMCFVIFVCCLDPVCVFFCVVCCLFVCSFVICDLLFVGLLGPRCL